MPKLKVATKVATLVTALAMGVVPAAMAANISGAGATFPAPVYAKWAETYKAQTHNDLNYQAIGSGGGIKQINASTVDFGASDKPLKPDALAAGGLQQFPTVIGGVVPVMNLPGFQAGQIHMTGKLVSYIYQGTIKRWNDPAIQSWNKGLKLPNMPITVVHRSDGSGTSFLFTTYLSMSDPKWAAGPGGNDAVNWPVGLGGKGSEGVTGIVKQNPGSIGYTELNYAVNNHLPVARIQNKAGKWVTPTSAGATAAIAAFSDALAKDVRTPIVDPPASAPDAYPISGFTFLLIPKDGNNKANRQVLKSFVQYVISDGQNQADALDYSKLPDSVVQLDGTLLNEMTAQGQPLQ